MKIVTVVVKKCVENISASHSKPSAATNLFWTDKKQQTNMTLPILISKIVPLVSYLSLQHFLGSTRSISLSKQVHCFNLPTKRHSQMCVHSKQTKDMNHSCVYAALKVLEATVIQI